MLAALTLDRAPNPRPTTVAAPGPEPGSIANDTGEALVAALTADPDNREAAAVYGDWLEARGDPRGRLVAIGNELAKSPGDKTLLREHQKQLASSPAILGPLWDCDDIVTHKEWSRGFIRKCRVALTVDRDYLRRPIVDVVDVIGWLLDEPGPARLLQDLTVGIVSFDDNRYDRVAAVLARRPRALRRLYFGDFTSEETELNWSAIGDVSALWPALPHLRELILRSGSMTLGSIHLPRLERLATVTGGMSTAALGAIANASWPALQVLRLQIGVAHEGAATDPALVAPILAGAAMPQLRDLGLANCEFTDEICEMLPRATILPRLRELDLSMGTMTDAGAAILAQHVRGLERLYVHDNYLSAPMHDALRACAAEVTFAPQRIAQGNDRHAAAFE